jgi:hypothetical protein
MRSTHTIARFLRFISISLIWLWSAIGYSDTLFTLGPNWNNFVFEASAKEDTPNYYGYGGRTSLGYSFGQIFDLALYGHYSPGRLDSASATDAHAVISDYGAETGLRILSVMYLGVRGGVWNYRLPKKTLDEEIEGTWSGTGGEATFGLLFPATKQASWQMTMDVGQGLLDKQKKTADELLLKPRKFSRVSVTISFVFNSYMSNSVDSALFNSFMKTFF